MTHTSVVTDNGARYRYGDFARIVGHQTRHQKTPRSQYGTSITTITDATAAPAARPASRFLAGVTNVQPSYS